MPEERIPFAPIQETGWEALAGAGAEAMNVVVDGKGALRRRPGIAAFFTADPDLIVDETGIVGLYKTQGGETYAFGNNTGERLIYRINEAGSVLLNESVVGSKRPTFAETQTLLVVAAGSYPTKIDLETNLSSLLGGNPPRTTHIVAHASRLAGIEIIDQSLRDRINYSGPQTGSGIGGLETWNGDSGSDSGQFPANARPDALLALYENTNQVFGFGATTLQVFASDPQTVYAPVNTRELGIGAPYSVIKDDQNLAWIDDRRRVVHSDGRTFNVIADAIKTNLDDMETIEDAFGYRVLTGPTDALIWAFPTDGRTFAYQRGAGWGQWSGWDGQQWTRFSVTALTQEFGTGRNLVGTSEGKIGVLSHSAHTDLGMPINAQVTTGFIDHGTQARKHTKCVRMTLRRGQNTSSIPAVGLLQWRDALGPWSDPLEFAVGPHGDSEVVLHRYGLGVYRSRQWRFTFSHESVGLSLASAVEVFEPQAY